MKHIPKTILSFKTILWQKVKRFTVSINWVSIFYQTLWRLLLPIFILILFLSLLHTNEKKTSPQIKANHRQLVKQPVVRTVTKQNSLPTISTITATSTATIQPITPTQNSNQVELLYELSKDNIISTNLWFGTMINVAMLLLAIIGIILAIVTIILTWFGIRINRSEKDTKELQKETKDIQFLTHIGQLAPKNNEKKELTQEEVNQRSKIKKGFANELFQGIGDSKVFALDEYGFFHWIPNPTTLFLMGYSWSDVRNYPIEFINRVPRGKDILTLRASE